MSQEIHTSFGKAVKINGHIVKVMHVAATQKYIISNKDGANNEKSFTYSAVQGDSFQAGSLIIKNWKLEDITTIKVTAEDTLENIAKKINDTGAVTASVLQDNSGFRMILESRETGINNTFHLAGDAIANLKAEVPPHAVKFMDIYNISGHAFNTLDHIDDASFETGIMYLGNGFVETQHPDSTTLKSMVKCINKVSTATNTKAEIIEITDNTYILRISTVSGQELKYTGGDVIISPNTQIKYSTAQNTVIIVDDIESSSPTHDIATSVIGNLSVEAIGDDVTISWDD